MQADLSNASGYRSRGWSSKRFFVPDDYLVAVIAIQITALNGFRKVFCGDGFRVVEIGYGACHSQEGVVGTR